MSLRKIVLFSLLANSLPLHAATEFPDGLVPVDVVREFAGGTVYRGLPDNFPVLLLPATLNLRLIASVERNESSQQLLLRSSLSHDKVREQLLAALTTQGWVNLSSSFGISGLSMLRLCHDQHGDMTINATPATDGSRLQVTRTILPAQFTRPSCAEQQADSARTAELYGFYNSLLPVLELPPGTVNAPPSGFFNRGSSSSFSSNYLEIVRDNTIKVPDTNAGEIFAGFAAQMRAQGWEADSSDAGEISASSVWTREVTPPGATAAMQLFATLSVLRGIDDLYGITLTLRSAPNGSSGVIGIRGIVPL